MKLILRDRNQELVDNWKACFRNLPNVEIGCGDIFDVKADAIVSPANSFGYLNGGIDLVYSRRFGWGLQDRLQKHLLEHHDGELTVGEAVYVTIDDPDYKYLISAPTMRVPMDVSHTPNAYLAMRAVLRLVKKFNQKAEAKAKQDSITWGVVVKHEKINSVLCPGLGTNIGRMPYNIAAAQMREAYRVVWENNPLSFENISASYNHHEKLCRGI